MKKGLTVFVCLALPAAAADSPGAPRVTNLSPHGWHRGSTVEADMSRNLSYVRGLMA